MESKPLLGNMNPTRHTGRREVRAKALSRNLEEGDTVLYIDTSLPKHSTRATVVVTGMNKLVACTSINNISSAEAEVATALALLQPNATKIITDSQAACLTLPGYDPLQAE